MREIYDLPNPKRDRSSMTGRAAWFPYYAGFSTNFAQAYLVVSPVRRIAEFSIRGMEVAQRRLLPLEKDIKDLSFTSIL